MNIDKIETLKSGKNIIEMKIFITIEKKKSLLRK